MRKKGRKEGRPGITRWALDHQSWKGPSSGCADQGAQPLTQPDLASRCILFGQHRLLDNWRWMPLGKLFLPHSPGPHLPLIRTYTWFLHSHCLLKAFEFETSNSSAFAALCSDRKAATQVTQRTVAELGLEVPGSPVGHFPIQHVLGFLLPQMYTWLWENPSWDRLPGACWASQGHFCFWNQPFGFSYHKFLLRLLLADSPPPPSPSPWSGHGLKHTLHASLGWSVPQFLYLKI